MQVKLLRDWRGYRRGEEMTMQEKVAEHLSELGIVELVKEIKKAPRDKMVRGAGKTK